MEPIQITNCHTHVFNRGIVPENFLPPILKPLAYLLQNKNNFDFFYKRFTRLNQHGLALLIKKYHAFLTVGDLKSQLEIFQLLQSFYPEGTKFCVLTMDMEYMGAGTVDTPFIDQLRELAVIKANDLYKNVIYPFIFVHPERANIFDLVQRYIEEKGFAGIKLYPPLGYYPFDKRLDKVFAYAEKYQIPITTHCARGGIYFRGKITDEMLTHPITGVKLEPDKNKYFTDVFTDPANYVYLLDKFPNLKINLAHFGGFDEWEKYLTTTINADGELTWYEKVKQLIEHYPSVYTDISYTMYDVVLFNLLKMNIVNETYKNKILFGSDFYKVEQQESEKQFYINIRAFLGEELFKQIAQTNPVQFLKTT